MAQDTSFLVLYVLCNEIVPVPIVIVWVLCFPYSLDAAVTKYKYVLFIHVNFLFNKFFILLSNEIVLLYLHFVIVSQVSE